MATIYIQSLKRHAKQTALLSSLALVLVCASPCLGQDRDVPLAEAIKSIQAFEATYRTIQFTSTGFNGSLRDPADPDSIIQKTELPLPPKYQLFVEPQLGKFRCEMEYVAKWEDGAAPFIGIKMIFAHNGEIRKTFRLEKHGKALPKEGVDSGRGTVDKAEGLEEFLEKWGGTTALDSFPPFFFRTKLSTYLQNKVKEDKSPRITEDAKGVWRIETQDKFQTPGKGGLRITFDPTKGGLVTNLEWWGPGPSDVWKHAIVTTKKLSSGFWVPERFQYINKLDKSIDQWSFADIAVNEPIEASKYDIEFPARTRVEDKIAKKTYVVGKDLAVNPVPIGKTGQEIKLDTENLGRLVPWMLTVVFLTLAMFCLLFLNKKRPIRAISTAMAVMLFALCFVSCQRTDSSRQSAKLSASPSKFDLGVFASDDGDNSTPICFETRVTNTSSEPVVVQKISVDCGLIEPEWKGGSIAPNESRVIQIKTAKGAWGPGPEQRELVLLMSDGSELKIPVTGEALEPKQVDRFNVLPKSERINVFETHTDVSGALEREAAITFTGSLQVDDFLAVSSVDWLSAKIVAGSPGTAHLLVRVMPEKCKDFDQLAEGIVTIKTKKEPPQETYRVMLYKHAKWKTSLPIYVVSRSNGGTTEIEVSRTSEQSGRISAIDVQTVPSGIKVAEISHDEDRAKIRLEIQSNAQLGQISLEVKITTATETYKLPVLLHIAP